MDGEDREPDGGRTAEPEAEVIENPPVVPSRLLGAALAVLAIQFSLLFYVLVVQPTSQTQLLVSTVLGLSFFAALLIGFDAYQTDRDGDIDWSPNPFIWAIPMFGTLLGIGWGLGLGFGLPMGVGLAYAGRRYQTLRRGLDHIWNWPAVGAGVLSGAGFAIIVTAARASESLSPSLSVVWLVTGLLFGFTTPAAFYDTQHVRSRLSANGENWLFRGYHWVVAMSVPHPLRSLVALGYALRRWMLLSDAPLFGSPDITADEKDDDKS